MPEPAFSTNDDHVVVATGDIDVATAPQLSEALRVVIGRGHPQVVLDLAGVDFMDSQGVRVIVRAHKQLERTGGALVVRGPQAQTRSVLEVTGLSHLIQPGD